MTGLGVKLDQLISRRDGKNATVTFAIGPVGESAVVRPRDLVTGAALVPGRAPRHSAY